MSIKSRMAEYLAAANPPDLKATTSINLELPPLADDVARAGASTQALSSRTQAMIQLGLHNQSFPFQQTTNEPREVLTLKLQGQWRFIENRDCTHVTTIKATRVVAELLTPTVIAERFSSDFQGIIVIKEDDSIDLNVLINLIYAHRYDITAQKQFKQSIKHCPDLNVVVNARSWTLLHYAVYLSNGTDATLVQALLEAGADPTCTDKSGATPLHLSPNDMIAKLLIEKGSKLDAKDLNGKTPFDTALENSQTAFSNRAGYFAAAIEILVHGENAEENLDRPLDTQGRTLLHYATALPDNDNAQIIYLLLEQGANPNCADDFGTTPLHLARNADSAQWLIRAYASLETLDNEGNRPLDKALLRCQTAPSNRENYLKAALEMIISADPENKNINQKYLNGWTLLHYATTLPDGQDEEFLTILLKNGADVYAADDLGVTPLHLSPNCKIAQILIDAGADLHAKDHAGNTPILAALSRVETATTNRDEHFAVALHLATAMGQGDLSRVVNNKYHGGRTLLHYAMTLQTETIDLNKPEPRRFDFTNLIFDAGGDSNQVDDDGVSPWNLCERQVHFLYPDGA